MKIVFVSNYINHHQIPLCDELYKLSDGNFAFVNTEKMADERIAMGWDSNTESLPYVVNRFDDEKKNDELLMEADCVIFGGAEDENIIIPRLEAGKFTIRYSERLYKSGRWKFITPRGLKKKHYDHTRFKNDPVYLLCAGAYVAGDFALIGAYPGKKFKFGYFPETFSYEDVHFKRKDRSGEINILWAGRFIDWKHPEVMIQLSVLLSEAGIAHKIVMAGNGELKDDIENEDGKAVAAGNIVFVGAKSPSEIRDMMLECDFFVHTADRLEGWGAVINEAMNSGAVVIAPKEIGAAPYLIKDGENGYIYRSCDVKTLYDTVASLAKDKAKRLAVGTCAYETIRDTWNAKVAAKRLWDFINDPAHKIPEYDDGPLSRA